MTEELILFFEKANEEFLLHDISLFKHRVSERTLCGALMLHLHDILKLTQFKSYYTDVEYNRNRNKIKTIIKDNFTEVTINCDLIVHSRGENSNQDNLIAIEMKKSDRPQKEKISDKNRLIALTKKPLQGVWPTNGKVDIDYICGYKLGVYYEVKYSKKEVLIEYYRLGELFIQKTIPFPI